MIDAELLFIGWFLGVGCGVVFCKSMFRQSLEQKADTGIRLECAGKLYTIHSVEIEE